MHILQGTMNPEQTAAFLLKAANALEKQIQAKLNPATANLNPTNRRNKILQSMRQDGQQLKRIQRILLALSNAHKKGYIVRYPFLEDIRHKSEIELLLRLEDSKKHQQDLEHVYKSYQNQLEKFSIYSVSDWEKAVEDLEKIQDEPIETNTKITTQEVEKALLELKQKKAELKKELGLNGAANQINYKEVIPELKLIREPIPNSPFSKQRIFSSGIAYQVIQSLFDKDILLVREEFLVLYLNSVSQPIGYSIMFKGGITATVADAQLIVASAVKSLAKFVVVAHNHPSNYPKPSEADIQLTKRLKEAFTLFGITLSDHLIITSDSYYSFSDEGAL